MHKIKITLLAASVSVLAFTSCSRKDDLPAKFGDPCAVKSSAVNGEVIEGQYIVAYNSGGETRTASAQRISQISREVLQENAIPSNRMKASFTGELSGFVASLSKEEAAVLQSDPSIAMVEPDRFMALSTCFTVVAPTLVTWNVTKVGYGNGTGKTAWVIDTGIDFDHPDLTVDQIRGKSFVSSEPSADDLNGHGTHVAGIIGAKNNNIGMLGVASGATLVPLKVLNKDGTGTLSAIIQALAHVNANGKAGDVVNMSLGEDQASEILDQQVKLTALKGIFISMAAGNDAKAANLYSPGRANGTNIYTISAVDSLGNFASFSNFGNDVVDFAAPGVRILSTYIDGKYAKMSGTSMAAPHVAGLLLLSGNNLHHSTSALNDPDGTPDKIAYK